MRRAVLALGIVGGVLIILAVLIISLVGLYRSGGLLRSSDARILVLVLVLAGGCGLAGSWLFIREHSTLAGILQLIGGLVALVISLIVVPGSTSALLLGAGLVIGLGGILLIIGAASTQLLQRR